MNVLTQHTNSISAANTIPEYSAGLIPEAIARRRKYKQVSQTKPTQTLTVQQGSLTEDKFQRILSSNDSVSRKVQNINSFLSSLWSILPDTYAQNVFTRLYPDLLYSLFGNSLASSTSSWVVNNSTALSLIEPPHQAIIQNKSNDINNSAVPISQLTNPHLQSHSQQHTSSQLVFTPLNPFFNLTMRTVCPAIYQVSLSQFPYTIRKQFQYINLSSSSNTSPSDLTAMINQAVDRKLLSNFFANRTYYIVDPEEAQRSPVSTCATNYNIKPFIPSPFSTVASTSSSSLGSTTISNILPTNDVGPKNSLAPVLKMYSGSDITLSSFALDVSCITIMLTPVELFFLSFTTCIINLPTSPAILASALSVNPNTNTINKQPLASPNVSPLIDIYVKYIKLLTTKQVLTSPLPMYSDTVLPLCLALLATHYTPPSSTLLQTPSGKSKKHDFYSNSLSKHGLSFDHSVNSVYSQSSPFNPHSNTSLYSSHGYADASGRPIRPTYTSDSSSGPKHTQSKSSLSQTSGKNPNQLFTTPPPSSSLLIPSAPFPSSCLTVSHATALLWRHISIHISTACHTIIYELNSDTYREPPPRLKDLCEVIVDSVSHVITHSPSQIFQPNAHILEHMLYSWYIMLQPWIQYSSSLPVIAAPNRNNPNVNKGSTSTNTNSNTNSNTNPIDIGSFFNMISGNNSTQPKTNSPPLSNSIITPAQTTSKTLSCVNFLSYIVLHLPLYTQIPLTLLKKVHNILIISNDQLVKSIVLAKNGVDIPSSDNWFQETYNYLCSLFSSQPQHTTSPQLLALIQWLTSAFTVLTTHPSILKTIRTSEAIIREARDEGKVVPSTSFLPLQPLQPLQVIQPAFVSHVHTPTRGVGGKISESKDLVERSLTLHNLDYHTYSPLTSSITSEGEPRSWLDDLYENIVLSYYLPVVLDHIQRARQNGKILVGSHMCAGNCQKLQNQQQNRSFNSNSSHPHNEHKTLNNHKNQNVGGIDLNGSPLPPSACFPYGCHNNHYINEIQTTLQPNEYCLPTIYHGDVLKSQQYKQMTSFIKVYKVIHRTTIDIQHFENTLNTLMSQYDSYSVSHDNSNKTNKSTSEQNYKSSIFIFAVVVVLFISYLGNL